MMQDLFRIGLSVKTGAKALAITGTGIIIDKDGVQEKIAAYTDALAAGAKTFKPMQPVLKTVRIHFETAGDAVDIARAFDAVHQGFVAHTRI